MSLYGKAEPRVYTPPLRELTEDTTLGFEVVRFARHVLGVKLYPWQEWLFVHALEIVGSFEDEWHFRFRTVVVLVARQQGKSTMGIVLSLFFLYVLQSALIIGTAQNLDQAEEVWSGAVEMAEGNPELAEEIEHVYRVNGKKSLELTEGRRYKVSAASRRAGRGKSGDLVLLDELREHQDFLAWGAITKTTMARPDALVWCMSNAGDGTSVVLRHLRLKAHEAIGDPDGICAALATADVPDEDTDDSTLALFEWSAPAHADVRDREAWCQANPSLGYGLVTERALASACATDPEDVFRTECLCQWVEAAVVPPFPLGSWDAGKDAESEIAPDSPLWYGVDVSKDRSKSAIAVAGLRSDNCWHVELIAYRSGIGWLQGWFADRAKPDRPMQVALQGRGAPISSMADVLKALPGVTVNECVGKDVAAWAGRLWDSVSACAEGSDSDATRVYHRPQPALDLAANIATTRPLGDGAWGWDRHRSTEDISPLVAVTMALGSATAVETPEQKTIQSAYVDDHDLLFV